MMAVVRLSPTDGGKKETERDNYKYIYIYIIYRSKLMLKGG